jgi:endoglycosylceramidase
MNEPWPGTNWQSCTTGCPDLEQQLLAPFHARMTEAVRSVDRHRPVYVEPFVLFNFGTADTSLPGAGSPNALSTHVYALDQPSNEAVMDRSIAAATRDDAPVLVTEWGATNDPAFLDQLGDAYDARLLSSLFWSYNEHVVHDSTEPIAPPNLNVPVLAGLARPYPQLVNGTPMHFAFDASTRTTELDYSTRRPDGRPASRWLKSVVVLPKLQYPTGYSVVAVGADVVSRKCAPTLALRHRPGAPAVSVRITPSNRCG